MHRASHYPCVGRFTAKAAVFVVLSPALRLGVERGPGLGQDCRTADAPALPETTKAVVLLDDETYTVDAKGQAVEHVRKVVKILRPQGRDDAYPSVWYDKDSKMLSLHAWSIDPAGHEYAVKDNEMVEGSPPGEGNNQYYEDIKFKVAAPPGRDPGGIVAYEYEKRERPYLAETDWYFQDDLPRDQPELHARAFLLATPTRTSWAHHPKIGGHRS